VCGALHFVNMPTSSSPISTGPTPFYLFEQHDQSPKDPARLRWIWTATWNLEYRKRTMLLDLLRQFQKSRTSYNKTNSMLKQTSLLSAILTIRFPTQNATPARQERWCGRNPIICAYIRPFLYTYQPRWGPFLFFLGSKRLAARMAEPVSWRNRLPCNPSSEGVPFLRIDVCRLLSVVRSWFKMDAWTTDPSP